MLTSAVSDLCLSVPSKNMNEGLGTCSLHPSSPLHVFVSSLGDVCQRGKNNTILHKDHIYRQPLGKQKAGLGTKNILPVLYPFSQQGPAVSLQGNIDLQL